MASAYADPDEATAALIALMIANDLDAEDVEESYHGGYPDIYDQDMNDYGQECYDHGGDTAFSTDPAAGLDGTWDNCTNPGDSSYLAEPVPTLLEEPDGSWDCTQQALPVKAKSKKKAFGKVSQEEDEQLKAKQSRATDDSNSTATTKTIVQPTPPKPHTPTLHERLSTTSCKPNSNVAGKRRADSPPAYRLPHRPHPKISHRHRTRSPKGKGKGKGKSRAVKATPQPRTEWGAPTPGSEDWDLLELHVPFPGSESHGINGSARAREIEEEERRMEDASVVEIRVGEDEDLWSLLGEMSMEEARARRGMGREEGDEKMGEKWQWVGRGMGAGAGVGAVGGRVGGGT